MLSKSESNPELNRSGNHDAKSKSVLSLNIPGKVFVLGEYFALSGGQAILATTGKGFHFTLSNRFRASGGPKVNSAFHPDSPAGRLVRKFQNEGLKPIYEKIIFTDEFEGRGGFGGSTAECIAAYRCFMGEFEAAPTSANTIAGFWKMYRQLHQDRKVPPSGYDLLAQIEGIGSTDAFTIVKELGIDAPTVKSIELPKLHLFQTSHLPSRKTRTHEHLSGGALAEIVNSEEFIERCEHILLEATNTLWRGHAVLDGSQANLAFGGCLTNYAEVLKHYDFEVPNVTDDRLDFLQISGVYGAKGCGAMGSDCMIVMTDQSVAVNESVNQLALEKGFNPLKFKYVKD